MMIVPGCLGRLGAIASAIAEWLPTGLFSTGVNGAWYDPSDLTTLYQNAAGTVPVTAVEQPVGRMLDKSGRGNHATNPSGNSANFPVLSARYNLLTKTEQLDDAVWGKTSGGVASVPVVTTNTTIAPNGTLTADTVVFTLNGGTTSADLSQLSQAPTLGSAIYTYIFWAGTTDGSTKAFSVVMPSGTLFPVSITSTGRWITITDVVAGSASVRLRLRGGEGTAASASIYLWGADLRVANDALNQPAYQRVNTATDYDTAGFKPYLKFNGVNQWLQTNSIDFSYGDKMFVSAGVRKLSDAMQAIAEFSTNINTNTGVFEIFCNTPNVLEFVSKGSTLAFPQFSSPSPVTKVVSGVGNISGDQAILRVNGTQAAISAADQGTGNYGNYPMFVGARAGTSLWFNGRLYQLVVIGKQASSGEIASTEAFVATKTGVTL